MSEHPVEKEYVEMMRSYPIPETKEKAGGYQLAAFGIFAILVAGIIVLLNIF